MAPLKIAIFVQSVQISDIAGIDLLGNCSTEYIKVAAEFGFGHLLPLAVDMEFLYIAESLDPALMTSGLRVVPTHTYETAPVDVDVLLVGGPPLSVRPTASLEYLKKVKEGMDERGHGTLMSTCVGSLWLADAGVLEGRKATCNRGMLPLAKEMHGGVEWLDQRWVVDEEAKTGLWTSGGAGCGIDMIAMYAKQRFDEKIALAAWKALEFDPDVRGQFY